MNQARYVTAFVILAAAMALRCSHTQVPLPQTVALSGEPGAAAARGEYIVRSVAVCGGCHAADEKNPDGPLSGGHEFTNWRIGTARASNLTADEETGLGRWTDAEIVRALRNGVSRDGRLLAPVMPYEWFHEMSDDDAFAVARYLKTLPPVRSEVKQSPNLVFKLGRMFLLKPKPALSASAPPRGATAEYGVYLTQHVGLCAECHTPRIGLLQKPDRGRLLAGVPKPPESFPAQPSNLTPDVDTGIGRWSEADFIQTIRTGKNPSGKPLHPIMPWPALKRMTDDDLRAMYLYLRTLPPTRTAGVTK
jgi:mono/diheme cytochrome c family protein